MKSRTRMCKSEHKLTVSPRNARRSCEFSIMERGSQLSPSRSRRARGLFLRAGRVVGNHSTGLLRERVENAEARPNHSWLPRCWLHFCICGGCARLASVTAICVNLRLWSSLVSDPRKNIWVSIGETKVRESAYLARRLAKKCQRKPIGQIQPFSEEMIMNRFPVFVAISLAAITSIVGPSVAREGTVMVGGAAMYPSKNIVQNAIHSRDHTTLVAAVKAAGLVDTLSGAGPFTVFAPTNAAFNKLPTGTVESLVKPENKATLTKILTYHVVPGRLEAADLTDGKVLTTVEGEQLTVRNTGGRISIVDAKGDVSRVTIPNVNQSNGVIHVVNTVLLPG